MANFKNTTINDTGFFTIAGGTTAQRPSSPVVGMVRLNTDRGAGNVLEFYDGEQWIQFAPKPVGTPANPFASVTQLSGGSGIQELFTSFGGRTGPTPVLVDFDSPGGPYVLMSFRFDGGGLNAFNDTLAGNHDGTNDYTLGQTNRRLTRPNNLGLGQGNVPGTQNFHPSLSVPRAGGGLTGNGNDNIQEQTVSYYNHATNSLLSSSEETALREWAKQLSQDTPHAGVIVDSDGGDYGRGNSWDINSYYEPVGGGHAAWIEEPSGDKALLTPAFDDTDEHHNVQLWTHNTYRHLPSSGATTGQPAGANEGLADLNSALLIPSRIRIYTYTGGGAFVATPWSPNARNGQGNFLNDRVFFLVRD